MKKALTRALLIVMSVVTLATVMPISANASTSNVKKIYNILTDDLGFNSAAACGILANIERESDFNPKLVIRDSNGRTSGGLCQWNGGRFNNLKKYCYEHGYDYLSIEGQLRYLNHELQKNSYKHIYKYLRNVDNTEDGAYDAAYYWCYYFEIPSNRSSKARQRGTMAEKEYWPKYGESTPEEPVVSLDKKNAKYDITDDVTIRWTSGGGGTDFYRVYIMQKAPDDKNFDKDNIKSVTTTERSLEIPAFSLNMDCEYAVLVRAVNATNDEHKTSKYTYFSVGCIDHEYTTVVLREPTFESSGSQVSTCEKCGKVKKATLPVLTVEDFTETKTETPIVTAASSSAVRVRWQPTDHATGYRVYIRENGKWKLLAKISADEELTYLYRNLDEATEYKFCVKAYMNHEGKTYHNSVSSTLLTSTETEVPEISELEKRSGKCTVSWDKVDGADGYQVYVATGKGSYKRVATVGSREDDFTVRSLKKGQTYRFVVRSYIVCSNGSYVFSNCSESKQIKAS